MWRILPVVSAPAPVHEAELVPVTESKQRREKLA
jgi:hypothetical protein